MLTFIEPKAQHLPTLSAISSGQTVKFVRVTERNILGETLLEG
jgi:hypothetical protein